MGLKTRIWASRLGFKGGMEEEEKEEKIPHMCESIGHRPLRGRCPKTGQDQKKDERREKAQEYKKMKSKGRNGTRKKE